MKTPKSVRPAALALIAFAMGSVGVAGEEADDAVELLGAADPTARTRAMAMLKDLRATTTRRLFNLAEQSLREGREETAIAAIALLGDWRSEDAVGLLADHLLFEAKDSRKKLPTLLTMYPCAGALAKIGVKGVEAAAERARGRGGAVTDTEVRLVAAIVTKCLGEDLGRAYCTFKRDQADSDDSRAVMERVLAKIGTKED